MSSSTTDRLEAIMSFAEWASDKGLSLAEISCDGLTVRFHDHSVVPYAIGPADDYEERDAGDPVSLHQAWAQRLGVKS